MVLWINKCFVYIALGIGSAMHLSAFLDPTQRESGHSFRNGMGL